MELTSSATSTLTLRARLAVRNRMPDVPKVPVTCRRIRSSRLLWIAPVHNSFQTGDSIAARSLNRTSLDDEGSPERIQPLLPAGYGKEPASRIERTDCRWILNECLSRPEAALHFQSRRRRVAFSIRVSLA